MEAVHVIVAAPRAHAEVRDAAAWTLGVQGVRGSTAGEVDLVGTQDLGSRPAVPSHPALLQVVGDLRAEARPTRDASGDRLEWTLQGSATYLGVDGSAARGSRIPAAVGGAGLLAALLFSLRPVRAFLGGYHRSGPLENVTRVKLLLLVRRNPGVTASHLAGALGVARPAVFFHARVLHRGGLLSLQRIGARWHLTPTAQASPSGPPASAAIAAAQQHPIRGAIVALLQDGAELSAPQLRDRLARDGRRPSPSHLAYHLQVLECAGAIERRRVGGRVRFLLAVRGLPSLQPSDGAGDLAGVRMSAKAREAVRRAELELQAGAGLHTAPVAGLAAAGGTA
jgi:DNA-binding transcriptional ArsR family regulator